MFRWSCSKKFRAAIMDFAMAAARPLDRPIYAGRGGCVIRTPPDPGPRLAADHLPLHSYYKMLIARAITSAPMPRDAAASVIISSLAHRLIAETSVGLNAVAVQKASDR